ncbi:polyribonucleotide nucleotidyltransferase 1, mitochondrial [Bombus pascuorum]|uniref:polyribonucleotide nucleotidyltransferase 1, mitochondrial n=1 Tax=Bombus pascuorum TaxID=65598 RepID=UPI0021400456|nr:polyribonucleotide nucleotidyltransferase 1, mitochondrial [Bombus pascuorum]
MVLFRHSKLLNNRNLSFLCWKSHKKNKNTFQVKFMSSDAVGNVHIDLSNGSKITLSSGKYARFTSGSVIATLGDTSVMSTVVRKNEPCNNSIIPLTVNYRQKASAIGRIPTNFLRREIGYTDHEILISRIIDRSVRPLFEPEYRYETQIICNLLASDGINNPDILSINAASAALSISDIPWMGPVAAVRVGLIDNTYIINPTKRDLQNSQLNLVLSSMSKNLIVMIEGSANDILEPELRKAIKIGAKECQTIIQSIKKLQSHVGKPKLEINNGSELNNDVEEFVKNFAEHEIREIFSCHSHDKISRDTAIFGLRDRMLKSITDHNSDFIQNAAKAFNKISKENFRSLVFETNKRCDGRATDELRDIECQVDLFQPLHGSAFFQRGQTQVLCTVTLDSIESSLKLDNISMQSSGIKEKNFFLHYEFPPYAVNETGKLTGYDRREVGHGALAERGLRAVIPKDYPFAIRLTSEVLESNGSSSMASVCGGSLALMDAGVPISSPVAGVAMGLICNPHTTELTDNNYKILTDISGIEDYLGDMDFKITGTKRGFTALQVDIKIAGVPLKVIMKAIENSHVAKNQILNIMNSAISSPASNKKNNKPVLDTIEVPVHQRGKFLGIGGSNIKKILYETGVNIHSLDDTVFSIFAPNQNAMNEAKDMINEIIQKNVEPVLTFGDIYTAKITEIRATGVMVTLYPSMVPALLPNSQLDQRKIHHPDVLGLNVGDEIKVKYFGRDPVNGHVRLSRKVLQGPIVFEKDFNNIKKTLDAHKTQL